MQESRLGALNEYVLLGRSGLRVSPLCLGALTFGEDWGWGSNKEESRKTLDLYIERGGNFIDTANYYTNGTSETFLGELMESRRDQLVLGTKFTLCMRRGDPNACGNHRKNIVQSVEGSLKRLKTDYIDIYWLHAWENRTPVDEVMRALDDLVRTGKVLYVGVSNAPAWKIAQANTLADFHGWSPFIALQIEYNLTERTVERELIPMARELNLGVTPWSPLSAGVLSGKYKRTRQPPKKEEAVHRLDKVPTWRLSDRNLMIAEEVQKVADEIGRSSAQVALNWLLQKPGVTSLIIGARTIEQLKDNLSCLDFKLSPEYMERLDKISYVPLGFPYDFLAQDRIKDLMTGGAHIAQRQEYQ